MRLAKTSFAMFVAAAIAVPALAAPASAEDGLFIPLLTYRTGPYAPNGIPTANGLVDYFRLINARDGGIEGRMVEWEECETGYNTDKGVECYERHKARALIINPFSTGVTYQLIEKAPIDKVPVLSMGYGRTDTADGRIFPWVFNAPMTYWSQVSAFVRYVSELEGGFDALSGKVIGLIYLDVAYGREPIPTLEALSEKLDFDLELYPVAPASMGDQSSVWLDVERDAPDWMFMWGWGLMNSAAVNEAVATGFPMDRFIGVWWSGAEPDVVPAGERAAGYLAGTLHVPGPGTQLHQDILQYVYDGDIEAAKANNWGDVLYNRTLLNAMIASEAIRNAILEFEGEEITGTEVRWGLEHLDITEARLAELGLEGFTLPIQVSCEDHEGNGKVIMQQWDGTEWKLVSDWIEPMRDVVRPMVEASAARYAEEAGITPRDCSAE